MCRCLVCPLLPAARKEATAAHQGEHIALPEAKFAKIFAQSIVNSDLLRAQHVTAFRLADPSATDCLRHEMMPEMYASSVREYLPWRGLHVGRPWSLKQRQDSRHQSQASSLLYRCHVLLASMKLWQLAWRFVPPPAAPVCLMPPTLSVKLCTQ